MRLTLTTAALACAGFAWLFAAIPTPAEAQSGVTSRTPTRVVTASRPRPRVTVRSRSYLDPGPEVMPYSQNYTDYIFLNRRPTDVLGPGFSNDRKPFPYAWEPGGNWRIP